MAVLLILAWCVLCGALWVVLGGTFLYGMAGGAVLLVIGGVLLLWSEIKETRAKQWVYRMHDDDV